eukprot:scaffold34769_cov33-Tisochrysis_lutea.AAC.3
MKASESEPLLSVEQNAALLLALLAAFMLAATSTPTSITIGPFRIASMRRLLELPHLNTLLLLTLYLALGNLFYTSHESKECESADEGEPALCQWSTTDALYFQMVTMSTVGYGDLTPSSFLSQLFTLFYILFGIIFVFTGVAALMSTLFEPVSAAIRVVLERFFPSTKVDLDQDGSADVEMPPPTWLFYAKGLLPEVLVVVLVQAIAAEGAHP